MTCLFSKHAYGNFYGSIRLGTTYWGLLKGDTGTGGRREVDLKDKGGFGHSTIAEGS